MAKKYLDSDGLLYFWQKIKAVFVPNTRTVNGKALSANITLTASDVSALPSSTTIPSAGTGTNYPTMDGTRALGSNAGYARVDHVHPSDTSRVPTTRTVNGKALSSDVTLGAYDINFSGSVTVGKQIQDNQQDLTDLQQRKINGKALSSDITLGAEDIPLSSSGSGTDTVSTMLTNIDNDITELQTDKAWLASPAFTGTPTAPTAATGTSTTQIATTEFVANAVGAMTSGVSDVKVDGTSVVTNGIASISSGSASDLETGTDIGKRLWPAKVLHDSITHYGECTTAAATVAKTVTINGVTSLYSGLQITVRFNNANTASSPTLNVNSLGAYTVLLSNGGIGTESGNSITSTAGNTRVLTGIVTLTYDSNAGGYWYVHYKQMAADWNASSNSSAYIKNKPTIVNTRGTAKSGGTTLSVVNTGDMYTWNNKLDASQKGAASGVCPLNASSKIDSTYLPSYVDDVIEAYARSGQTALSQNWLATGSASGTVITPETGKIYVLMADSGDYSANTQFRWGGTAYVKLADGGVSSITNAEIDTIVAA